MLPNQAAVLLPGIILGDERLAQMARRSVDLNRVDEFGVLPGRITLRRRQDLSRHFWVSAGLVILTDANRSLTVGIGKEMMDATPGGSVFWFFLDFSGKGEVRFRSFDLGTGRWIFAGIRSCVP